MTVQNSSSSKKLARLGHKRLIQAAIFKSHLRAAAESGFFLKRGGCNIVFGRFFNRSSNSESAQTTCPKCCFALVGNPCFEVNFAVFNNTLPMACPSPVSYTHLDVYKRQMLCFVNS